MSPLPNYCNPKSGIDIDLVRVTAAFCFWVARDLLSRPGWELGAAAEGKQLLAVTGPALRMVGASLSLSPSLNLVLLLRNYISHLHLSVNIKARC